MFRGPMAERVKVAHVITRLDLGGAQQNTLYCCANHDRKKYDVLLFSGVGGYLDADAKKIKNLKTYFLPELKHPIRPWWDLIALFEMAAILRKEKVQVVHTHSSKAGFLGRWAAKMAGVPVIIHTVHGWGFFEGQFFLTRWLYILLEKWTAPITDRIITVSAHNRAEGLGLGIGRKEQYQVIHSGILPQNYLLPANKARKARAQINPQNRPAVLILSNFKKQKSPFDVVDVAVLVKTQMPKVLFIWAGDGPLRSAVEEKAADKGLTSNFKWLGWREDVAELLAASDVLLLTSLHEGLPRVVLQAMAAGKPVVATAVNGTPEVVREKVTGFLAQPHDIEKMAWSIVNLLSQPSLARRMGRTGQKALRGSFLMDRMLEEIETLYGMAIKKGH